MSSKWLQTKSYSLSLPQVRCDINPLQPNIQISRSISGRLFLNFSREFEFPSWINKPLFGTRAIVLRFPSRAIFAILNKRHYLWICSAFLDTILIRRTIACFLFTEKNWEMCLRKIWNGCVPWKRAPHLSKSSDNHSQEAISIFPCANVSGNHLLAHWVNVAIFSNFCW